MREEEKAHCVGDGISQERVEVSGAGKGRVGLSTSVRVVLENHGGRRALLPHPRVRCPSALPGEGSHIPPPFRGGNPEAEASDSKSQEKLCRPQTAVFHQDIRTLIGKSWSIFSDRLLSGSFRRSGHGRAHRFRQGLLLALPRPPRHRVRATRSTSHVQSLEPPAPPRPSADQVRAFRPRPGSGHSSLGTLGRGQRSGTVSGTSTSRSL